MARDNGLTRMSSSGQVSEFDFAPPALGCVENGVTYPARRYVRSLARGLDDELWFIQRVPVPGVEGRCILSETRIGHYNIATGSMTDFPIPDLAGFVAESMTVGPDGAFWILATEYPLQTYVLVRFNPPGLRVTVTSDKTTAPATTAVTATVVVKNTSDVTTPPGRLTLTEGEGVMYAHKGETDNGTFGTIAGRQNVV